MAFSDKVMNALKKVGQVIHNPKTGNKITIPSALTSDDPNLKQAGEEMADKVIAKAKAQMKKSSGLMKKLDRQRRKDDPGVKIKGYDKTDPYTQKVHTLKHKQPKKTEKDPNKPKADHEHEIERTMSPANKKKYDAAVKQAEKDFQAQLKKMDPSQQSWETARQYYDYEVNKAKEKYQDPLTPDQQAYQDYKKARTDFEKERRRGDQYKKDNQGRRAPNTPYLGQAAVEPKPSDFPGAQDFLDKQKGTQDPYNPKGMDSDDPSFYDPEKELKRRKRVGRTGKELSRKEAKQYVKENKEEVLKYVIKRIIKEEKENLITEGTRWLVGIEQPNGKVTSTYGHYDGYPEWAGKHLKKYYNNPAKAKELLKLGKSGISTIGPKIKGSKDHSFEKPDKGVTVFYGRDRGEKDNWLSNWKNRDAVKFNSGEEYAYIYNLKEKQWYYKAEYGNPREWTKLK